MAPTSWKVFYPQSSWSLPSGVLVGVVNHEQSSVTVTTVVDQDVSPRRPLQPILDLDEHLRQVCRHRSNTCSGDHKKKFEVVGLLIAKDDVDAIGRALELENVFLDAEIFLLMLNARTGSQPECVAMEQKTHNTLQSVFNNSMFIAFDSSVEYQVTRPRSIEVSSSCSQNGKLVDHAMACLTDWNSLNGLCDLKQFGEIKSKRCDFFIDLLNSVLLLLLRVACCPLNISAALLKFIFSPKIFKNWVFDAVISWPATGCQLKEKFRQVKECAALNLTKMDVNREMNLLLLLAVDFALGISLVFVLHQVDFSNILASEFMEFANTTAVSLEQLLHWLMGAPAGLKLNRELASFLGQFFLYHIYLWVGYLSTIAPFLAVTIKFASLCGCLGLSVFVALASDVLSILTFHVYCFYVYAARIYCLQVHGLMAFWRLFRGKKWNVLRQRVDSSAFRVDQLFLGTLLFTILLFLLPTTALFYTVFTLLRLAVLIPLSVVAKVTMFLNRIPISSLFLWTVRPGFMVDGISFHPVPRDLNQKHGWLLLKMKPMSLMKVMSANALDKKPNKDESSWKTLGQNLFSGYLVYPWGGKRDGY